jgi:hypothetical protein
VHQLKGLEADNVMVLGCNSWELRRYKLERGVAQFDWTAWGDELNLLYVALTRAKKLLCVPTELCEFVGEMRKIEETPAACSEPVTLGGGQWVRSWTTEQVGMLRAGLQAPWKASVLEGGDLDIGHPSPTRARGTDGATPQQPQADPAGTNAPSTPPPKPKRARHAYTT